MPRSHLAHGCLAARTGRDAYPRTGGGGSPRSLNRLKRHLAVATRYDKLAVRYQATLEITAINEWHHLLQNTR
ncbi:hypothetical protein Acsp04_41170 [Actinomadura sp. NBRC 104425]|nr:hypothetical protein Acsp04_41170 [Actinomadura sp. NBRC 104425]